jgi:isopenicillin N synthase-like dioxygenase
MRYYGEMGTIVDAWRVQQYAQAAAPIDGATLEPAMQTFFEFLKLPEQLKKPICRTLQGEGDQTRVDFGYMRRQKEMDGDAEEKMYFHYHPDVETLFAKEIEAAGAPAKHFMAEARHVWDTTRTVAHHVVNEFEAVWPGVRARFFPPNETPFLVIRFLTYDARGMGDFLAKAHYDRGDFTIALGESAPGLRIGTPDKLVEVEHKDGYVVVMPGTGFPQDIDATIVPAWHDVVQKPEAQLDANTARWAVVGFFDVVDKQYISIEDTHVPR